MTKIKMALLKDRKRGLGLEYDKKGVLRIAKITNIQILLTMPLQKPHILSAVCESHYRMCHVSV